jgi:uncharacterized repeat protein (TIGR01451 family)
MNQKRKSTFVLIVTLFLMLVITIPASAIRPEYGEYPRLLSSISSSSIAQEGADSDTDQPDDSNDFILTTGDADQDTSSAVEQPPSKVTLTTGESGQRSTTALEQSPSTVTLTTGGSLSQSSGIQHDTPQVIVLETGPRKDSSSLPGIEPGTTNQPSVVVLSTGSLKSLSDQTGTKSSDLSLDALEADLQMTKTDSADPVKVGVDFDYVITVTNNGPDTAENVITTDTLPGSLEYVYGILDSPSVGFCSIDILPAPVEVNCNFASLAAGEYFVLTLTVHATSAGPITNTAQTASDTADPNPADNSASQDTTVVNPAPEVTVTPATQVVQYSDQIATLTITGSDYADEVLGASTSWSADGFAFNPGLPDFLVLSTPSCIDSGGGKQTCTWTINGSMDLPEGAYTIRTTVSDDYGAATTVESVLNVLPEDATIVFDESNPVAVLVMAPGGNSEPFSLTVYVTETEPDTTADPAGAPVPGDISRANVSMSLVPVGPGSSVNPLSCTTSFSPSGYAGEMTVMCDFAKVPVSTYTVQVVVDGGYYDGAYEDVLTVYDPSLGFTTGGGWFYWPGTTDKTTFGYTMKYNKKGKNVKGNLLIIRHMDSGSLYRLKSNALYGLALGDTGEFTWASFSGKATYLEPGWPEAIGNHQFVVYAEDNGEPGSGSDRFWIEVQAKDGTIMGLSIPRQAIDNAIILRGGNIIVPHGGGG